VVLNLIDEGLGRKPAATRQRHNDLDTLAGTWSDEDLSTFSEATAGFEAVDPALWK
jgi:hypothetical protein